MSNNKKSKWLPWLIGILAIGVIGKTVSWFTWEREAREAQEYQNRIQMLMPQGQQPKPQTIPEEAKKTVPGVREGEFTLKVNRFLNDETTVRYLIPVDENGKRNSPSDFKLMGKKNGCQ